MSNQMSSGVQARMQVPRLPINMQRHRPYRHGRIDAMHDQPFLSDDLGDKRLPYAADVGRLPASLGMERRAVECDLVAALYFAAFLNDSFSA